MSFVNADYDSFTKPVPIGKVTFNDEKNRAKLLNYLERVGNYTGFDNDMLLRVFVDENNDFCAFEAIKYRISFVSTAHKLIDMISDCRCIDNVTIPQLRSMIANHQY